MRPRATIAATVLLPIILSGAACSHGEEDTPPLADDEPQPQPSPLPTDAADVAIVDSSRSRSPRACTEDAWCDTPVPPGNTLEDVWSDENGIAWAVTREGGVLRWNGRRWETHFTTEGALLAIWGSSPTDLWVGGERGLFHGDGSGWTASRLEEPGLAIEDIAGAGGSIWAVGRASSEPWPSRPRVYRYSESESAWADDPLDGIVSSALYAKLGHASHVSVGADGDVWILAVKEWGDGPGYIGDSYLFRRPAGQSRWMMPVQPPFVSTLYSLALVGNGLWAVGSGFGPTYCRSSRGVPVETDDWKVGSWLQEKVVMSAVWGLSFDDVWVAGAAGQIRRWDGDSWIPMRVSIDGKPIEANLKSLFGRSNDDIWAVGDDRALHKVSFEEAARLNSERAQDR